VGGRGGCGFEEERCVGGDGCGHGAGEFLPSLPLLVGAGGGVRSRAGRDGGGGVRGEANLGDGLIDATPQFRLAGRRLGPTELPTGRSVLIVGPPQIWKWYLVVGHGLQPHTGMVSRPQETCGTFSRPHANTTHP
jgi:hypothetical protein